MVRGSVASCARRVCLPFFWGRKPSKQNLSQGRPEEARVADAWGAGIAHDSDILARLQPLHDACHRLVFVELVVGEHRAVYVEVLQQLTACACVLCQNQIGFLQDAEGPHRDVLQIAYGCGYDI